MRFAFLYIVFWLGLAPALTAARPQSRPAGIPTTPPRAPTARLSPIPTAPRFGHPTRQHFNSGFFIEGWCYRPYYFYDPWWDYPPPPYYDYYGYGGQYVPAVPPTQTATNAAGVSTTYTSGYRWGLDRRLRLVSKKDARKILRDWWPAAPDEAREDFRRGFIDGYGPGGADQFDKLLEKALRQGR